MLLAISLLTKGLFELGDFLIECGSVSVEGSSLSFGFLALLFGLLLFKLALLEPSFYLFLLDHLRFLAVAIELLLLEFNLLIVLQRSGELAEIFAQCLVFEGKFIDFRSVLFNVVSLCLVGSVKVKLGLDAVVLLVEEVDLVLQLGHNFFVRLLMIFQIQLFEILTALVKATQAKNFVVSGLNFALSLLEFLFELQVILNETLVFLAHFVSSLVCTSQFLSPFLVARMVFDLASRWTANAIVAFASVFISPDVII